MDTEETKAKAKAKAKTKAKATAKPPKEGKGDQDVYHYRNTAQFLLLALQTALDECVPRTYVRELHYDTASAVLRLRLAPGKASGERLRRLFALPEVEAPYAHVNDPVCAFDLWGIEACFHSMRAELELALSGSVTINARHCELVARRLTMQAVPHEVSSSGFSHLEPSAMERSTFDSCGSTFLEETAGSSSADAGINFSVLSGQRPRVGTAYAT
jgi:hypothetical protein